MSGGHFDYKQYALGEIADQVDQIVREQMDVTTRTYSKETIEQIALGHDLLRRAQIYAQRIDWLVSGDDSEQSFHKRLKEDLESEKHLWT